MCAACIFYFHSHNLNLNLNLFSDQMALQMPGGNVAKIGEKRRAPEEEKKSVDPRDLVGRFRSKRDIYDYLLYHRKI